MDARAHFLSSAALSYATIAPATAAHLMSRCHELPESESGNLTPSTSMIACSACGCIDTPGWTSHRELRKSGSPRAMQSTRKVSQITAGHITPKMLTKLTGTTKVLKTECLMCGRTAKTSVPCKERIKKPLKVEDSRGQEQVSGPSLRREKRSKTRNKSGLQAILAKSKASATAAPGLDLMDLMRVM